MRPDRLSPGSLVNLIEQAECGITEHNVFAAVQSVAL